MPPQTSSENVPGHLFSVPRNSGLKFELKLDMPLLGYGKMKDNGLDNQNVWEILCERGGC
jgi:hypothetical protein